MDPYEAWASANDYNEWVRILIAWNRVHSYRWVDGNIRYPFPLAESRTRRTIAEAAYLWLAAYYRANRG